MKTLFLSRRFHTTAIFLAVAVVPAMALDSITSTTAANGAIIASTSTTGSTVVPHRQASVILFSRYSAFVGSDDGTRSLIQGLRYSEPVVLGDSDSGSVKLLPPTRPMGWGSVDRALSLAQSDLASQGITQPTAAQLKIALNGGNVVAADGSVIHFQGVLTLRSQGMGWGQIAHTIGVAPNGKVAAGSSMTAGRQPLQPGKAHAISRQATVFGAGGARIGHGAIVTAGGSLAGNDDAMLSGGESGHGRSVQKTHASFNGSADSLTNAPAHFAGNTGVPMQINGNNGNHFGNAIGLGGGSTGNPGVGVGHH